MNTRAGHGRAPNRLSEKAQFSEAALSAYDAGGRYICELTFDRMPCNIKCGLVETNAEYSRYGLGVGPRPPCDSNYDVPLD
jgi:hypothetical protein